jgi:ABC-type proline/glycine betaine transport system permease subunit
MDNLNKNFGKLIFFLCISISVILSIKKELFLGLTFFIFALIFLLITYKASHIFSFPAKAWIRLGVLLSKFFNPITLGMIFYLLISPVGILTRIFGRDELLLKKKNVKSYWLYRDKNTEQSNSFQRQF